MFEPFKRSEGARIPSPKYPESQFSRGTGSLAAEKTLEELDMGSRRGLKGKIRAQAPLAQRLPMRRVVHDPQRLPAPVQQPLHSASKKDETIGFATGLLPVTNELKETGALHGQRNSP